MKDCKRCGAEAVGVEPCPCNLCSIGAVATWVRWKPPENGPHNLGKASALCCDQAHQLRLCSPSGNRDLGPLDSFGATDVLEHPLSHHPRVTLDGEIECIDERCPRWQSP